MVTNGQIKGVITYLTKLTHTINAFRLKFINISFGEVTKNGQSVLEFQFDLDITSKEPNSPYIWEFFYCKAKYIIQDACEMVNIDLKSIHPKVGNIYYEGKVIQRWSGYIPDYFIDTVDTQIQQTAPKKIKSHFYCEGKRKELLLNITYKLSQMYIDDGITTDISVYCSQVFVDGKPLENIPQGLAETIVGYISESDDIRYPLDGIVWDNITQYMDLEDCELWTHTYAYFMNIGDVEIKDFDYVNHSVFSSNLCDFISGDY
jgi:hypothetical protein